MSSAHDPSGAASFRARPPARARRAIASMRSRFGSRGVVRGAGAAGGCIALTFDDGPNGATTDTVLELLAAHGASATFFMIGGQVAADPGRVRAAHDAGHEIANHTWSHPDPRRVPDAQLRTELQRTNEAIFDATGLRPALFRAPYGSRSRTVDRAVRDHGLRHVLWDLDTRDWSRPGTDAIIDVVDRELGDGSIVLLHDGGGDRSQTLAALPDILQLIAERGLRAVTVSQLLTGTAATTRA